MKTGITIPSLPYQAFLVPVISAGVIYSRMTIWGNMHALIRPEFTALPAVKKHALITMRHTRLNGWLPAVAIAVTVSSMDPPVWNSIVAKHKMGNLAVLKNHPSVKRDGNAPIAKNSSWEGKNKVIIAAVGVNVPRVANKWTLTLIDATFRRPRTLMKSRKRNEQCNWPSEKNGGINKEETPQWGYEPFDPIQRRKTKNNQMSIRNPFQ